MHFLIALVMILSSNLFSLLSYVDLPDQPFISYSLIIHCRVDEAWEIPRHFAGQWHNLSSITLTAHIKTKGQYDLPFSCLHLALKGHNPANGYMHREGF